MTGQVSPRKMNDQIIPYHYVPRPYQAEFIYEVQKSIEGKSKKRFFFQVWHRRSGKDKTDIADPVPRQLLQKPCLVKYVYPTLVMGRDNLWNGIGADGFRYINHIPDFIRAGNFNDTRMTIPVINKVDQQTPSLFQVSGSDNPDSLRGGNPVMFIFSEWSEQDPYAWDVVEPILRENNGIAIFNLTPKGDNHARAMYEYAKDHPLWFVQKLTYKDTGVFTEEEYQSIVQDTIKRFTTQGRSEEEALAYCEQEYMCSFDSPVIGSYYGAAMAKAEADKRITRVPYDATLPVHTAWDLGMDDSMTIWFFQIAGLEIHFIDYYENSGEGLTHYAQVLQDKKYVYGNHFAPHDISVREIGTGKSRLEVATSLGINFITAPKLEIEEGINAARLIFNQCWFDKDLCYRGIQCLKNYKKDWSDKNMVFRTTPLHNWASHGADAFRCFAVTHNIHRGFQMPESVGGVKPFYEGMPG